MTKLCFYSPVRLEVGNDCIKKNIGLLGLGKRCLIVTGKVGALMSGAFADVTEALEKLCIPFCVYDGIAQNPTVSSCIEASLEAVRFGADFIIGIGGGSPLDAAKAIAVFSANEGMTEDGLYSYDWQNDPLPTVCVGTTAGTGSEVTPVSVLTDKNGVKRSIRDDRIYPVLSLGDPRYTRSLPNSFTVSCALDALSHCIESYFSKKANDISRLFAVHGARQMLPVLFKMQDDGVSSLDEKDREVLYVSSLYAGYAIGITGTAFPHAMGYFLSERYGVAHGTACSLYLPHFLQHAKKAAESDARNFSRETGYDIDVISDMLEKLTTKTDIRLCESEILSLRERFVNNNGLLRSPGNFSPDDAAALLKKIFKT